MTQLARTISAILYIGVSPLGGGEHALDDVRCADGDALDARHVHTGGDECAHELRRALVPIRHLDGELAEQLFHPSRRAPTADPAPRDEPVQGGLRVGTEPGAEA